MPFHRTLAHPLIWTPIACLLLTYLALGMAPSQTPSESSQAEQEPAKSEDPPPAGIRFGPDQAWISIPVRLEVTQDYLEFLLSNPHGGVHESLLSTQIDAQILNTAFLAMGLEPGKNAAWHSVSAEPLDEGAVGVQGPRPQGATGSARDNYRVEVPKGDGLYLYLAWKEGPETFLFRLEDLVRDLDRGRTLRRHKFVYLGSFMTTHLRTKEPQFAASMDGNLINAAFFKKGATLFTTAVEECDKQSNWLANSWLLPKRGSKLLMIFSKETLVQVPEGLASVIPVLPELEAEPDGDEWR